MSLLRWSTRTKARPEALLVRLLVAGDLLLDGARAADMHFLIGSSRLERLTRLPPQLIHAGGYLEFALALLLALGLLTRAVSIVPLTLAGLTAVSAYLRIYSLQAAAMLDATIHQGGVALASLYLLLKGAGPLSLDAVLSRKSRRR